MYSIFEFLRKILFVFHIWVSKQNLVSKNNWELFSEILFEDCSQKLGQRGFFLFFLFVCFELWLTPCSALRLTFCLIWAKCLKVALASYLYNIGYTSSLIRMENWNVFFVVRNDILRRHGGSYMVNHWEVKLVALGDFISWFMCLESLEFINWFMSQMESVIVFSSLLSPLSLAYFPTQGLPFKQRLMVVYHFNF